MDTMESMAGPCIPGCLMHGGKSIHGDACIHGGEPTYIVAWPAFVGPGWMAKGVAPPGPVTGLTTMYGFPAMHLAFPQRILIKVIRYQE